MKYAAISGLLTAMMMFSSCLKDDDNSNSVTVPTTGKLYVSCVLDSTKTVSYEHGVNHYRNEGGVEREGDWAVQETRFIRFNNKEQLGFSMTRELEEGEFNDQYVDFFTVGEKDFATLAPEDEYTSGIRVFYLDENGMDWSTDKGGQEASSFTVVSHFDIDDQQTVLFSENYITQVLVNCALYNGLGDTLQVTNGKFRALTTVLQ